MHDELTFESEALALENEWESEAPGPAGNAHAAAAGASPCSFCVPLTHFAFDKATLEPAHQQIVRLVADTIAKCVLPRATAPLSVWITGHADQVGTDGYNVRLGERRARSVEVALKTALDALQPGSSARVRFVVTSRGESQPLGGASFSRRVDICWEAACPACESKPCQCPPQRDCKPCDCKPRDGTTIVNPGAVFALETETFVAPLAPLTRGMPSVIQNLVRQIDQEIGKPIEPARADSRSTLRAACSVTPVIRNGQLVSVSISTIRHHVRQHCNKQLGICAEVAVTPPKVTPPRRISPTAFEFSYEFRSRPPQLLEQLLKQVAPSRTLQFFHRVRARVELVNGRAILKTKLEGSEFPSHRVYVNGTLRQTLKQHLEFSFDLFPEKESDEWEGESEASCSAQFPPSEIAAMKKRCAQIALEERARWNNGTLKEWDSSVQSRLVEMWQLGAKLSASAAAANARNRVPWSAAFISWVMAKGGAGTAFKSSGSHTEYLKAAKANRTSGNCNPFKLYRVSEVRPEVGDLIANSYTGCSQSGTSSYDTFETQGCSHCDVVVKVEPDSIVVMGGNLSDSVGQRSRPTKNGFVIPNLGAEPCWGVIKVGSSSTKYPSQPPPPAPSYPSEPVNRTSAEYVRWYQQSLNLLQGAGLVVDGIFGPITKSAVRSFQSRKGLVADGIVGPITEGALVAAGAGRPPGSSSGSPQPAPGGGVDIVTVRGIQVARSISAQLASLLAAADGDGARLSGSGYRTSQRQIELRKQNCGKTDYDIWKKPSSQCTPPTAIPGQSMHEQGLAIDFTYNGAGITSRNSPGFLWLQKNASRFGLKNLPSEAWHWSVNGR